MLEPNVDTDFKALVITGSLPWWSLMAARMGAKMLSAWIYVPTGHVEFARKHFVNCPMYDGSTMGPEEREKWREHLSQAVVLFLTAIHGMLHSKKYGQVRLHI